MGLVDEVVPRERLDEETAVWCVHRELAGQKSDSLRFMKFGFNADTDHGYRLQALAHGADFCTTEEGNERPPCLPGKTPPVYLLSPHALVEAWRKGHGHVPRCHHHPAIGHFR